MCSFKLESQNNITIVSVSVTLSKMNKCQYNCLVKPVSSVNFKEASSKAVLCDFTVFSCFTIIANC